MPIKQGDRVQHIESGQVAMVQSDEREGIVEVIVHTEDSKGISHTVHQKWWVENVEVLKKNEPNILM
jgi:hypothetical protein